MFFNARGLSFIKNSKANFMKNGVKILMFLFLLILIGACEDDDYITTELDSPTVEEPMLPERERHQMHDKLSRPRADQ